MLLAEDNYEDLELWYPFFRLIEAGVDVVVAGTGERFYQGKYGYPVEVEGSVDDFLVSGFDGVVVPGGWAPDHLRRSKAVLSFVRELNHRGRLVAAICHGVWVPVSAGIVQGREVTCADAIVDDVGTAGGVYGNRSVVVDGNLVTSRKPADLPDFCREMLRVLNL
jgi:protease I